MWFLIPNTVSTYNFPGLMRTSTEGVLFYTPKGADNKPTGELVAYLDWANKLGVTVRYDIGEWNHIVATFERPTEKVYINGVFKGSKDVDTAIPASTWIKFGTGDNPSFPNTLIDEVRIYNRALSQAEIRRLMYMRGL
jgi:hypothetical protein